MSKEIPDKLFQIGHKIRTQDNRCTDQPLFAVMQKREFVGSEDHHYNRIAWVCDEGIEAGEVKSRRLEALYHGCRDVRGWHRYAVVEIDEFVTACFTEQGCNDYIHANGHNLNKPFIYAFGSYRNAEFQEIRNWLSSLGDYL